VAPGLVVEQVDVPGPPTSAAIRGAGWVEAAVLLAGLEAQRRSVDGVEAHTAAVVSPEGAEVEASIGPDGVVRVQLRCGAVLDPIVLRSYAIGAAHMALGWVTSEGLAVDADGTVGDLTIRSFGVLRSSEMPLVEVTLHDDDSEPVNGSDAVFAAVAAAVWSVQGWPTSWPTGRPPRTGAVPQ
jgi:xanthine dehydrogenase small subunit